MRRTPPGPRGRGWNREDCLNTEAELVEPELLRGREGSRPPGPAVEPPCRVLEDSLCRGVGRGVYGGLDWVVSADFTQPFIFTPRNSLSASVYAERQSLQNVFVREAFGVNLALTRLVGGRRRSPSRSNPSSPRSTPRRSSSARASSSAIPSTLISSSLQPHRPLRTLAPPRPDGPAPLPHERGIVSSSISSPPGVGRLGLHLRTASSPTSPPTSESGASSWWPPA